MKFARVSSFYVQLFSSFFGCLVIDYSQDMLPLKPTIVLKDLPSQMTLLQLLNTSIISFDPIEPYGYFVEKLGTRES
jgi:hypothetical protein